MSELFLLRGVSGSGKSTLANALGGVAVAADDYHTDSEGNYKFDPSMIVTAHDWCFGTMVEYMDVSVPRIIIHNTFTSEKHLQPYIDAGKLYGYQVTVLVVENRHGNSDIHNVPEEALQRQEMQLQQSIKLR